MNRFEVAKMNRPASKHTTLRRWLSNDFLKNNPEIYKNIYAVLENNNPKDFLKCYKIFVDYIDDDEILKKITTKTLITTGENDVGSTPKMSRNLSKLVRGSKFVEIKKGRHLCGIECADDVKMIKKSNFVEIKKGKHLCSIECKDDVNMIFKKFIDQHNDAT